MHNHIHDMTDEELVQEHTELTEKLSEVEGLHADETFRMQRLNAEVINRIAKQVLTDE